MGAPLRVESLFLSETLIDLSEEIDSNGQNPQISKASSIKAGVIKRGFDAMFEVVTAQTPEQKTQAQRLRWEVFCKEHEGFEDPNDHPFGLEGGDPYDDHAQQILLYFRPLDLAIGTARLILPNPDNWRDSFPTQKLWDNPRLHTEDFVQRSGEYSRLALSRERRNYIKETYRPKLNPVERIVFDRFFPSAISGLLRGIGDVALSESITNVIAVMEPDKRQKLQDIALKCSEVGPHIDFHGVRQPFWFSMLDSYNYAREKNPCAWAIITDGGRLHDLAKNLEHSKMLDHLSHQKSPLKRSIVPYTFVNG